MPKLEEVNDEDIDNMDMDLAQFDPSLRTPVAPKIVPQVTKSTNYDEPPLFPNIPAPKDNVEPNNERIPMLVDEDGNKVESGDIPVTSREEMKSYQLIYPCYFDINRSHQEGRRVSKKNAVKNPLAMTISDACLVLGLKTILEPDKTHPQDFGNPGRVRVMLKQDGEALSQLCRNKRALLNKISVYLKKHETTLQSVKQLKLPNFDPQLQSPDFKPRTVPHVKGFKMNSIVPLHSPLLMGHPQLQAVYTKDPVVSSSPGTSTPQLPKKKFLKVRR